jgi:hypothetical protein
MNSQHDIETTPEHREIAALIPWYVNSSIDEVERRRVEAHLRLCAACCADLRLERQVYEGMSVDPGVEYLPAPSLRRLQSRLDAFEVAVSNAPASEPRRSVAHPLRRAMRWQGLMAASVAVMAVALSLLAADRWMQPREQNVPRSYRTVTSSAPRAADEVIRAVFAPNITLVELQTVLDESQLRIVSGPSAAGVYSLAASGTRPVSSSLQSLRKHPSVRFAESTQLTPSPDAAP